MAVYDSTGEADRDDDRMRFRPLTDWPRYLDALRTKGVGSFLVNAEDYVHLGPYLRGVVYAHVVDKQLCYVGMSMDWERRREQHREARDWDEEWLLAAPLEWPAEWQQRWAYDVECALISHFAPPYNYAPGRGSSWSGDVFEILREQQFTYPGITVAPKPPPRIVHGPSLELARLAPKVRAPGLVVQPRPESEPRQRRQRSARTLDEIIEASIARRQRRREAASGQ